jgi:hypothetical protein
MKLAKRVLAVSILFVFAVGIFAAMSPRAAHAIIATFVQVTNTAANPVPVVNPPTAVAGSGSADLVAQGTTAEFGPFDVSNYANIRFYGDPAGLSTVKVYFTLVAVDASGNKFLLDELSGTAPTDSHVFVTGAYSTPGKSLMVSMFASCVSGTCPGTVHTSFVIYGR